MKGTMAGRIEGRVAVVTGGCSGIGLATVRRFVEEGAKVVIGDLNDDARRRVVEELGGPDVATFVEVDVTDKDQVDALFRTAKDTYGSVDIAFNNAGISPPEDDSILDTDLEAWELRAAGQPDVGLPVLQGGAALHARAEAGLDHQHRVVRGGDGRGHLADLLLRIEGRRAVDDAASSACSSPGKACGSTRCAPVR